MSDKNIYQRINSIMRDCDYLQKKEAQQGKGIKYDEVVAMLREHLIQHGVVMVIRQPSMECLNGVEGTKQKIYQGFYEMDLINIDKPDEKVTHTTFAHGMDGGDKGPGKAHTYAVKTLLVKGFAIETGEDEESRSEKIEMEKPISVEQAEELKLLLKETNSDVAAFCHNFGCDSVDGLLTKSYVRAKAMIKAKMRAK
jgi:hypothetical protein